MPSPALRKVVAGSNTDWGLPAQAVALLKRRWGSHWAESHQ